MVSRLLRTALRSYIRHSPIQKGKRKLMEALGPLCTTSDLQPVRLPGNVTILTDLNEHVQRFIYYFGLYEGDTVGQFLKMLQPGMTVVDIGANVGQYTLLAAAAVGPTGAVHAFEPDQQNFARLQENIAFNSLSHVVANQAALSDCTGEVTLYSSFSDNAGEHSLYRFDAGMQGQTVPALTLDVYMQTAARGATGRVDMVKIDVQGAEEKVLRGAETILREHRPLLLCEFEERWLRGMGSSTRQLKSYLCELGYVPYRISRNGLQPVPPEETHSLDNLVLLPEKSAKK